MFIELSPKVEYTEEEKNEMSGKWRDLLASGGDVVSFYSIEVDKLVLSTQKGWDGKGILRFLLEQPEIIKVTWDSQDYTLESISSTEAHASGRPRSTQKERRKNAKKAL
jgi:hypothetical protein